MPGTEVWTSLAKSTEVKLVISDSNKAISSWVRRQGHSDKGSSSATPVTELIVENCKPLGIFFSQKPFFSLIRF
jgi:hypothetical protein